MLSPELKAYIPIYFVKCGGNSAETKRRIEKELQISISRTSIFKYIKLAGLEPNRHGGRRIGREGKRGAFTKKEKNLIYSFFYKYGGIRKAVENTGYSWSTIYRLWIEKGLIKKKKSSNLESSLMNS